MVGYSLVVLAAEHRHVAGVCGLVANLADGAAALREAHARSLLAQVPVPRVANIDEQGCQ